MTSIVDGLTLQPDELAFHFAGDGGVDVDALSNFLRRASTVAKGRGAELRAVGLRDGSLVVKLRVIAKSKIAQNASKKFVADPLDGAVKVTALVGAVAGAIIWMMSPAGGDTPVAKAGAQIVEEHNVTQISIVTNNDTTVIMDRTIARALKEHRRLSGCSARTLRQGDRIETIGA